MEKEFVKSLQKMINNELDLCIAASQAYAIYSAFVQAGFTEDQALKIVLCLIKPTIN